MKTFRISVLLILELFIRIPTYVKSSAGNEWHYRGMRGPDHWHIDYPHCGGTKQSPISILTDDVIIDENRLTPIVFTGYDSVTSVNMTLTNNGHTEINFINNLGRKSTSTRCRLRSACTYVQSDLSLHLLHKLEYSWLSMTRVTYDYKILKLWSQYSDLFGLYQIRDGRGGHKTRVVEMIDRTDQSWMSTKEENRPIKSFIYTVNLNERTRRIRSGGLPGVFIAEQFHFHWGAVDSRGSEHDVDGVFFPMEMHVVHYNHDYGNFHEAMDKEDGLAVLAFFFELGRLGPSIKCLAHEHTPVAVGSKLLSSDNETSNYTLYHTVGPFNSHFEKLIEHFRDIHFKDKISSLQSIPLTEFIPSNLEAYYRYQGSLTTPPCYESVSWTVFHEKIQVAEEQLEAFRTMIFGADQPTSEGKGIIMDISDDYRPLQCLNNRKVYASREKLKGLSSISPIGTACRLVQGYTIFISLFTSLLIFI